MLAGYLYTVNNPSSRFCRHLVSLGFSSYIMDGTRAELKFIFILKLLDRKLLFTL